MKRHVRALMLVVMLVWVSAVRHCCFSAVRMHRVHAACTCLHVLHGRASAFAGQHPILVFGLHFSHVPGTQASVSVLMLSAACLQGKLRSLVFRVFARDSLDDLSMKYARQLSLSREREREEQTGAERHAGTQGPPAISQRHLFARASAPQQLQQQVVSRIRPCF